jgi:urease accessory protein
MPHTQLTISNTTSHLTSIFIIWSHAMRTFFMIFWLRALTILALLFITPLAAVAHTGADTGIHHGFLAGALHPITGLDHLAAMLAVGLWSALSARRAWPDLLWAPLGFAAMLLMGAMLGLQGANMFAVEPMIAASLLVLGLLVTMQLPMPNVVAIILVGIFAVFHGLAHGNELANEVRAWPTLAGMLFTTISLHATGIAIGWTLRHRNAWLPRTAGTVIACFGATLLVRLI